MEFVTILIHLELKCERNDTIYNAISWDSDKWWPKLDGTLKTSARQDLNRLEIIGSSKE